MLVAGVLAILIELAVLLVFVVVPVVWLRRIKRATAMEEAFVELQKAYPGATIIRLPENEPTEIICEISATAGASEAIAVINRSAPHYHNFMTETYTGLRGKLTVYVNGARHRLKPGKSLVIYPGQVHWAEGGAWVRVVCNPPWKPEDHVLIDV